MVLQMISASSTSLEFHTTNIDYLVDYFYRYYFTLHNGNRTEWSPIQSVIIRVINKIE